MLNPKGTTRQQAPQVYFSISHSLPHITLATTLLLTVRPCLQISASSLTSSAYLVELFPYAQRARGIGFEQFFGKLGGFFTTNVNPIAMPAIGWKFMAIYCGWITFEFLFIYFFYPETSGRTLEELAFCKFHDFLLPDGANKRMQCSKTKSLRTRQWSLSRSVFITKTWRQWRAVSSPLLLTMKWQLPPRLQRRESSL